MTYLWVLAAVAAVLVMVRVEHRPASAARIARFARRHGLDLTPGRQEFVATYLEITRKRRTGGVLIACLVALAWMLPQQRFGIDFVPALAGWLLGAIVAEGQLRRRLATARGDGLVSAAPTAAGTPSDGEPPPADESRPPAVEEAGLASGPIGPRWLLRLPVALVIGSAGSTGLALWLDGDVVPVVAWGLGAIGVAGVVGAVTRQLARSRVVTAERLAVDRATRRHSIAAFGSVGLLLWMLCLLGQASIVGDGLFGRTAWAVNSVVNLCFVGALLLAVLVWDAARPGGSPRLPAGFGVLLVAASAVWIGVGVERDRPPFSAQAVQASAHFRLTDFERFDADAQALSVTKMNPLVTSEDQRSFVGRIDLTIPAGAKAAGSYFTVVVIDARTNVAAPMLFGPDGGGWSGTLALLPLQYPWLSALAPQQPFNGWSGWMPTGGQPDPMSASFPAAAGGPLELSGMFLSAAGLTLSDLQVVLILMGPQQQTFWAVEVPVTGA